MILDGRATVDGGLVANVPMEAALGMGSASLEVLDAADACRATPPRHIAEVLLLSLHTMMSPQARRVPRIAARVPVLYLCRPCPISRSPFDFTDSASLIERATVTARRFLREAAIPAAGQMSGAPHRHHAAEPGGGAAPAANDARMLPAHPP